MNNLLDFIKNPKDREDFLIAIVVIALFGAAIVYAIFPKNNQTLTEQELTENLTTALAEGNLKGKIFTDIESSDEFPDLKEQKTSSPSSNQPSVLTDTVTTTSIAKSDIETSISMTNTDGELYDKNAYKPKDVTKTPAIVENKNPEKTPEIEVPSKEKATTNITTAEEKEPNKEIETAVAITPKEKETLEKEKKNTTVKNDKVESEIATATKENSSSDEKEDPATPETESDTTPEATVTPTPYEKTQPTTPKTKAKTNKNNCVIVVGAFKKAEGALLIEQKLKDANYKVTTGYVRGLKYVGVPVDCNGNEKLVKEINEKFEKEAWILRR